MIDTDAKHTNAAREGGVFDTIAAISTGQVLAAIGIVRVSGPDTLSVLDKVFMPLHGGGKMLVLKRSIRFHKIFPCWL